MTKTHSEPRKSMNWDFLRGGLFIPLVVVLCALVAFPARPTPRLQPILVQMAAERPDATLGVIVQKRVADQSVEEMVARLGGTVTQDLTIINAFAADLPARAVQELATANGVKWVSLDAPMVESGGPDGTVNTSNLLNTFDKSVDADKVWANGYQGSGVTVAVVDSGVATHDDLNVSWTINVPRILASVLFNSSTRHTADFYGHGTHVAGIIGGNGYLSGGRYIGIAPKVSLVSVKVSDDNGVGKTSDTIAGLQWVLNNHSTYNIRVVNLSLNSSHNQSYNVDPLDAAVEILWFNKIVVVVAAGNAGRNALYPPANDPFVITVGADDEMGTAAFGDDNVASFSGWGKTLDGFVKPDLIAPGFNLISTIARPQASLAKAYPDHRVGKPPYHYFRMSGTSMAAPVVSGVVALLLQDEPNLTPDQVKYRLMNTTRNISSSGISSGAGLVNAFSAINGTTTKSANTGQSASRLLWTGGHPITWGSVNWDSVNWDSVNWDSVNWDSVNWDSVNWDSDYWGP